MINITTLSPVTYFTHTDRKLPSEHFRDRTTDQEICKQLDIDSVSILLFENLGWIIRKILISADHSFTTYISSQKLSLSRIL